MGDGEMRINRRAWKPLLGFAALVFMFQNCGQVAFENSSAFQSKVAGGGGQIGSDDQLVTTQDENLYGEVTPPMDSEAVSWGGECDSALQSAGLSEQGGFDSRFNGTSASIGLRNAGNVLINGNTLSIVIDGANSVSINGSHDLLCIRAKEIADVNGVRGRSGKPIVFIGQGADASIDKVNGNSASNLVLKSFKNIGVVNGSMRDVYISGGEVGVINGSGGDLHLKGGVLVHEVNGHFKTIYASADTVIEHQNGSHNLVIVP